MNNLPAIVAAITPVVEALERLGVSYHIGGSVASSVYGLPRLTIDADIVADIQQRHVMPLVRLLEDTYYIDADMIRDAIRRRASFNMIHHDTIIKIDIFIPKLRAFDQEELSRVSLQDIEGSEHPFYIASPEGTILNKLEWYRMGGEISDRQWNDILGVLKVRGETLDIDYLRKWAASLKVTDLLERAFEDAGLIES